MWIIMILFQKCKICQRLHSTPCWLTPTPTVKCRTGKSRGRGVLIWKMGASVGTTWGHTCLLILQLLICLNWHWSECKLTPKFEFNYAPVRRHTTHSPFPIRPTRPVGCRADCYCHPLVWLYFEKFIAVDCLVKAGGRSGAELRC